MMDEETIDPVPESSVNTTVAAKPKKKVATAKKADKAAIFTKANEAVSSKKMDKKAPSTKKVDKEAEPLKEKKKTTLDLICEAIEVVGEGKKGASVQAIKKYIIGKTGSTAPNFNSVMNKAFNKGLERGVLDRTPASKTATGAQGHFRLARVEAPKRTVKPVKRSKIDSEHASDSEAVVKPTKPRKRNLSDTYIQEMKANLTSTPKPSLKIAASKDTKQTKKAPKKNATDKKDTSDSKIVVKKIKRKSVKSYSSDTEADFKKSKSTKTAKEPVKKTISDKAKTAKAGSPSKAKAKKLYNAGEGKGTNLKTKAKKAA